MFFTMEKIMRINLDEVREYIKNSSQESKIYLGADSERVNVEGTWYVDYLLVVVVHIDGRHGCKVFGDVQRERDYDKNLGKPRMRLFTEVMKIGELYSQLVDDFGGREVDVHLDINPNEMFGSSCVIGEAVGYIKGMCGLTPKVKPHAFAASICADRLKTLNTR
jgi:hypothetical protein